MGGAPIGPAQTVVNVLLQETPLATAKIAVFVFEDDNPLNGENDSVVGLDPLNPIEPGLGGFEITLFDAAGGTGDRKSTRLNSSYQIISYAVFCLKKKTTHPA